MNTKMIRYILGKMLGVEAVLLLLPALVSLIYREFSGVFFLVPAGIAGVIFLLMGMKKPENRNIYGKEGMIIVASAWILWSVFGALPFSLSGSIPNYLDAFFETVSGFTTTGSTILEDIEALPQGMLFWRSFTHWIGGMGVLVFVLVLTTLDKKNTMYLMRAEVPGPEKDKLVPKTMSTARILYGMYFGMTAIEVILLLLGGLNLFDSLIFSFGTAGTGGFANYSASVGYYNSAYIDGVITIFMILFGVNFNLYFFLLMRDWKPVWKNEELKTYLLLILSASLLITLNMNHLYANPLKAFRYAVFQVASIITTTGYASADYTHWPMFSQCVLLLLMIIGASASSTGGGMKVARFMMMAKCVRRGITQMIHPKAVSIIRMNGKKVDTDVLTNLYIYLMAYIGIVAGSVLLVSIDNMDFGTTFSSVLTTLNNIGPGIEAVGPNGNFAHFSPLSKLVFCFDMLAGRLEIFPFLMLFTASAWNRKF